MLDIEYNHNGDIKLGLCTDIEVQDLLHYVKVKCMEGCLVFLKKTELNEYYLSVPITLDFIYSVENPYLYTHDMIGYNPFYFVDFYIPDSLICITYDTDINTFVSNIEHETCVKKDFTYEHSLYEILPFSNCNWESEEQYNRAQMHMAKQLFVCSG